MAGLGTKIVGLFAFLIWVGSPSLHAAELHDAVKADDLQRIVALISAGANVNELDLFGTPLHIAAARGSVEIAKVLIDAGADLEAEADQSQSRGHPLHTAAVANQVAIATLLIERGAKIDTRDSQGRTPLFVAAYDGHAQIAELLLKSGADPLAEDASYHQTPIHAASIDGRLDVVKLLLSAGVDINLKSHHNGETPLMCAVMYGRVDVIGFLLANGADPNIANNSGKRPMQIRRVKDMPEIRDLLIKFGASE